MLALPHSGFGAPLGPPIHADDCDGLRRGEFKAGMALACCPDVSAIGRSLVAPL